MHKILKTIMLVSLIASLVLISGCSIKDTKTKVTEEVEELETEIKDDLDSMENEAYEDVNKMDTVSKNKITEAFNYLKAHYDDPLESEDIALKNYYYSSYITAIVDKKGVGIDNDMYNLALSMKRYIKAGYKQDKDIDDTIKNKLNDFKDTIADTTDDVVDKFYEIVK